MPAEFRPARAEDVDQAVDLIYSSGPDAFEFVFGPAIEGGARAYLRRAFTDGAGEFGCRNHIVGVRSGEVVAAGGGWSGDTGLPFLLIAARQFFTQFGPLAASGAIYRGLMTESVLRPPTRAEFYIGHLGVRPDLRGIGLGSALLETLLEQGRGQGHKLAVLDVSSENPRAEALYTRHRFRVTAERSKKLENRFGKVVMHRRMERSLAG